ncbi:Putative 115 kDa protein in type-1 retrotransposable element R1DM-like Protein [Tribolium castaneum]|uniref:115 kDa protein in type-1 retrotransposable element R1DM-like Protein n=1 Tax=Tribolium castaneum TaxID=7070 RepID=D7EKI4_TRICA|nr:Putative 115 kDa protein in type-1 retrotransposable element R1DM-like Protein [Tribolium castaneum]
MTRAKQTFKEKVEKRRQKCCLEFAENDLARNPWGVVYKLASEKFKTRGILQSFQTDEDDNITRDFQSTMEFLITNLFPDDDPDVNIEEQRVTQSDFRTTTAEVGSDVVITEEEVDNVVSQIQNKKAPGLNNLKGRILKKLHPKITPLITKIYNACWTLNYFPTTWKKGPPITFSHHKSQVPTGHGNFGIHQLRLGKSENSKLCPNCPDFDDDPVHRILEGPLFGEVQERIRGITGTWPPDLTQVPFIDNDEVFSALSLDLTPTNVTLE